MNRKDFFASAGYGAAAFLLPTCIAGLATSCTVENPVKPTPGAKPVLTGVIETISIDGITGGTTAPLTANDTLDGVPVVLGTATGQVTITGVTVPAGLTLNANGTVTVAPNTPKGNYNITYKLTLVSDSTINATVTSTITVTVALPALVAVNDTLAAVNGTTGGNTVSVTANDTINGVPVVIGTGAGQVKLSAVTSPLPAGLTLNLNTGVVTVAPNTAAGAYSLTYKIAEITNPTNTATATSNVTVTVVGSMPVINAVTETTAAINGVTGGTTASLTANDTLNGVPVVIGTAAGQVKVTAVTVPAGLTLNLTTGTVTVAPGTAAGNLMLTYKITEITNPTNSSQVTSTIVVTAPAPTGLLTINLLTDLLTNGSFKVYTTATGLKIIVARTLTGTFIAVAAACTHAGTSVNYVSASNSFHCNNHGQDFTSTGAVTGNANQTTKALTQYATTVTGTTLTVN